jgi:hypothetical protein
MVVTLEDGAAGVSGETVVISAGSELSLEHAAADNARLNESA